MLRFPTVVMEVVEFPRQSTNSIVSPGFREIHLQIFHQHLPPPLVGIFYVVVINFLIPKIICGVSG